MKYLLLLFALFILGCNYEKPVHANVGIHNAMWCQSIYLRGVRPSTGDSLTVDKTIAFAKLLRQHKVKYAYLFSGPYGDDGHLPSYPYSAQAKTTVDLIKRIYPEVFILPWIGGVENQSVHLGDSSWVNNALSDTKQLIRALGVPGVHVDFEFILPGDEYLDFKNIPGTKESELKYGERVNAFLSSLRSQNPSAFISTVVVATSPEGRPWKRKTSITELNAMIASVDQLCFLYYDTRINDNKTFDQGCFHLLNDIAALKKRRDIQYLIAAGTFENEPELRKYRNMSVEALPNTINTIKNNLNRLHRQSPLLEGLGIYCDWETDEKEWRDIDDYWFR